MAHLRGRWFGQLTTPLALLRALPACRSRDLASGTGASSAHASAPAVDPASLVSTRKVRSGSPIGAGVATRFWRVEFK